MRERRREKEKHLLVLVIPLNLTLFLGLDGQDWLEEISLSCMHARPRYYLGNIG